MYVKRIRNVLFFGYFGMYSSVLITSKNVLELWEAVKCSKLLIRLSLGEENCWVKRCHFIYMRKREEDTQAESKQLKHSLNQNIIIYILLHLFMTNIKSQKSYRRRLYSY